MDVERLEQWFRAMVQECERETEHSSAVILSDKKDRVCRFKRPAEVVDLRRGIEKGTQDVRRDERTVRVLPVADFDLGDPLEVALGSAADGRHRALSRNSSTRFFRSDAAFSS